MSVGSCRRPAAVVPPEGRPADVGTPAGWPYALDSAAAEGEHGAVSSDAPLAAAAGAEVLRRGGNAVDGAIAAALAIAVVAPLRAGLGGGGFLTASVRGETAALDFRDAAPAGASRDMYGLDDHVSDGPLVGPSRTGARAAAVPGLVAGLWAAHRRFGTRPWPELVAPAIRLAEEGFVVDTSFLSSSDTARLTQFPSTAALYFAGGARPRAGARWRNPDLARTLRRIADAGAEDFYRGETAHLVAAEMARDGGVITAGDLAAYEAKWRDPVVFHYRGREIVSAPPPTSGGVVLATMANILEGYDLRSLGWHSPAAMHLAAEAMRRAYGVRDSVLGDPDFVRVPRDSLLDPRLGARARAAIARDRATASGAPCGDAAGGPHTTNLSVVDARGDAVALTMTVGSEFGSGVAVAGAGFVLNDVMDDFAAHPGRPNRYGLVMGDANAIAPGKRPLSSQSPTIVRDRTGRVVLVVGGAGGPQITTATFQVLSNVLDFGMSPAAAVRAPRFHHQCVPDTLFVERGGFSAAQRRVLTAMGHAVREVPILANENAVGRRGARWQGGPDPRAGGAAVAF